MKKNLIGWLRRRIERQPPKTEVITQPDIPVFATASDLAAGLTDCGRVRSNNEDLFLCDPDKKLFIVADGMGGHAAGEQASRITVETIWALLNSNLLESSADADRLLLGDHLEDACRKASAAIVAEVFDHPEWHGMGSTVVVALLRDGELRAANVGDSRLYLVRDGKAQIISRDHTVVGALVEQGGLQPEDIRSHPLRNQLTSVLGQLGSDGYTAAPLNPHLVSMELNCGDRLVLCSDGLWEMLEDETIAELVTQAESPAGSARALIDAANNAGGEDNITVVVIFFNSQPDCGQVGANKDHMFDNER